MRMYCIPSQAKLLRKNRFFGKAVLGLIQAFSFNWLYFEIGMEFRNLVIGHADLSLQIRGTYIHMPSAGTSRLVSSTTLVIEFSTYISRHSHDLDDSAFPIYHGLCFGWGSSVPTSVGDRLSRHKY